MCDWSEVGDPPHILYSCLINIFSCNILYKNLSEVWNTKNIIILYFYDIILTNSTAEISKIVCNFLTKFKIDL